jgi:hypothetical protein
MTAFATDHTLLDARVREAWALYRDRTADLTGSSYDEAEAESWGILQEELRDVERERLARV